jgi:glycosyltransferase involved in cell wall biosynthesis
MVRESASRIAVVIPAYRPSNALVEVVRRLAEKAFAVIVLVDDGSGPKFADTFAEASAFPGVRVLRHAANLGKGAALKTGINHALCEVSGLAGIVTADADGQHHPEDIERTAASFEAHPESLVLGCRTFGAEVPLRSRFGNLATSGVMRALMGRKFADTQTGLRAIPASLAVRLLKVEANGYEFELEMLVAAHNLSVPIVEEPIRTIYEPGNPSSHFNPIVDSMKIYFVLLRFGSVSLLTALLDNLVFILARHYGQSVLASQILGRIVAVGFNYTMVRSSVFYSRQRHMTVLPKYLMLVLASGTVSYDAIRLLTAKLGIDAISAKLLAETVLFLVNFAVERMFIFKPEESAITPPLPAASQPPPRSVPTGWLSASLIAMLAGLLAVEVYGFRTAKLFSQEIWLAEGVHRFFRFANIYLGVSLTLLLLAPWTFAGFITMFTAAGTAVVIGPQPLLAVAFFLVSSCALGSLMLGRKTDAPELQLLSTLLGIAAWIFLMSLIVRFPVHYEVTWVALLAIPILCDWRGAWRRLMRWRDLLRQAELRSVAERLAFALLVFILLAHWLVALLPEVSFDGLAMHLAIPYNIATHHAMTFEPARFLWAVMPMGADFTYAINYLLGGEYAAHLFDFALLLLLEALLYYAVRRWVTRTTAFLLLALFASTPLVQLVTGSLFVENLVAVMVLGFLAASWRFGETGEKRFLYLAAALGGTAMATKFGALAFVAAALPFLILEAARWWKALGRHPVAVFGIAAVLLLATALPPYAIAYWKTADPLFPFLHDKFPQRLLPVTAQLKDERFVQPLTWNTPYDLTFRTRAFQEGQNGSFGFQYMMLVPLAIAALLLVRRRSVVSAAVVSLVGAILILRSQPNARYLYAAMPLLSVPFAALLGWATGRRWLYHALIWPMVACIFLNLCFLPSAGWYHRDFDLRRPFSRAERDRYRAQAAPIREVIAYYNRAHPNSTVLLTSDSSVAGLDGTVYENQWHQYSTFDRIRNTGTLPELLDLVHNWNVQYLIAPKKGYEEVEPAVLKELLERCTEPEFESGDRYLARLQSVCRP